MKTHAKITTHSSEGKYVECSDAKMAVFAALRAHAPHPAETLHGSTLHSRAAIAGANEIAASQRAGKANCKSSGRVHASVFWTSLAVLLGFHAP